MTFANEILRLALATNIQQMFKSQRNEHIVGGGTISEKSPIENQL